MSGGAGYALNKLALIQYATEAFNNSKVCKQTVSAEDQQLGICLEKVGVIAGDSRDADGFERFVPLPPQYVIPNVTVDWYSMYVNHQSDEVSRFIMRIILNSFIYDITECYVLFPVCDILSLY